MKRLKKAGALVLALLMTFVFAIPAMAAETAAQTTYSITIRNENAGHTYQAYQIFAGDVSSDAQQDGNTSGPILSNITWGNGIDLTPDGQDSLMVALSTYNTVNGLEIKETDTAAQVAEKLAAHSDLVDEFTELLANYYLGTPTGSTNVKTEDNTYVIDNLPAGYYLVRDQNRSLAGDNDTYTEYIVQVLGNVTMTPKSDMPVAEKKVDDKNDSNTTEDRETWQDSADYDIGDEIPFQLTVTLPNNFSAYESYTLAFVDNLSQGLTYKNGSAEVFVDGVSVGNMEPVNEDQTLDETAAYNQGTLLIWNINDIKDEPYNAEPGDTITIKYTATLNNNAVIGSEGNPNEFHIIFSNNPNGTGVGKTPDDTVIVFTYQTIVNKVDKDGEPLAGAAFKLEKKQSDGSWQVVEEKEVGENITSFTFTGLDDGDYRLTETVTPTGYNTIEPIEFTIAATHEATSADPQLTELNGNVATGEITFTPDATEGSLSTDVVNVSGSTLPETGGMGTTVFYVVGGVLVAGVLVLLVAKRRMGRAE